MNIKELRAELSRMTSAVSNFTRKPKVFYHPETVYSPEAAEALQPENPEDWLVIAVGVKHD